MLDMRKAARGRIAEAWFPGIVKCGGHEPRSDDDKFNAGVASLLLDLCQPSKALHSRPQLQRCGPVQRPRRATTIIRTSRFLQYRNKGLSNRALRVVCRRICFSCDGVSFRAGFPSRFSTTGGDVGTGQHGVGPRRSDDDLGAAGAVLAEALFGGHTAC